MNRGIELINEERKKQLRCWKTPEHDASVNHSGQLSKAAAVYALGGNNLFIKGSGILAMDGNETISFSGIYPWDDIDSIKPKDRIKQLQIAGALIAAEIDRLLKQVNRFR